MLTKEERDGLRETLIQFVGSSDFETVRQLFDDLDAKDAAIAALKQECRELANRIAELTTALDDAAHALADLTEQRDAALVTVRNDSRDITALNERIAELEKENCALAAGQCKAFYGDEHGHPSCHIEDRLTKAEAALRVYRRCCHGRDGCFCTKDAAHYFAAKEKETP